MKLKIHKINPKAIIPTYGTKYSAGFDLYACVENDIIIQPNMRVLVGTGLTVEIPDGFFGAICSRSGLTIKNGIVVPNAPGVIDADYRGELKIILYNISNEPFTVLHGMRIAQMIILSHEKVTFIESDIADLSITERGSGGFGSTSL